MISFLSSAWICLLANKIDDFICNEYFKLNISNKVTGESCMSWTASWYFHSSYSSLIWIFSCCQLLPCTCFAFFLEVCVFLAASHLSVLFCRSSFHFLILVDDDAGASDAVWFLTEVLSFDSCPTDALSPFPTSLSPKIAGARSRFPLKLLTLILLHQQSQFHWCSHLHQRVAEKRFLNSHDDLFICLIYYLNYQKLLHIQDT